MVLDTLGVFRAVSPAWTAALGHAPSEVVGRDFHDFIHPDDARPTEQALGDAASRDLTAFENRYLCKGGGFRWISWKPRRRAASSTPMAAT